MKNEKLFRETPFGGYKREDVLSYIEALDNTHKAAIEELNERILELNDQLSEDARQRASMEKELEIVTQPVSVQAEEGKTAKEIESEIHTRLEPPGAALKIKQVIQQDDDDEDDNLMDDIVDSRNRSSDEDDDDSSVDDDSNDEFDDDF